MYSGPSSADGAGRVSGTDAVPAPSPALGTERRLPTDLGPQARKANGDVRVLASALEGVSWLAALSRDEKILLFSNLYRLDYEPGEFIVRQGQEARNFYVMVSGRAEVTVALPTRTSWTKKVLGPGECFGEIALLHGNRRTATVRVEEEGGGATVWAIDRAAFKEVLGKSSFARRKRASRRRRARSECPAADPAPPLHQSTLAC